MLYWVLGVYCIVQYSAGMRYREGMTIQMVSGRSELSTITSHHTDLTTAGMLRTLKQE